MTLEAQYDQAAAAHRRGDLVEAERLYRAALKSDARNAMLLYLLAVALAQQGRNGDALPLLSQSIPINPQMPDALFARAQLLLAAAMAGLTEPLLRYILEQLCGMMQSLRARPRHRPGGDERLAPGDGAGVGG